MTRMTHRPFAELEDIYHELCEKAEKPPAIQSDRLAELASGPRSSGVIYDADDLPEAWVRLLYGFPSDTPLFSRSDALLRAKAEASPARDTAHQRRRRWDRWSRQHQRRGC